MTSLQLYRNQQASRIPSVIGAYALCDLDEVPIYVGQSVDGIRARVRRHLTSARSDVIANRMIDVWEVAYVWCWPMAAAPEGITTLEHWLFHKFNDKQRLMNGTIPPRVRKPAFDMPELSKIQILPDEEIKSRLRPENRLPRQINHFNQLMDYVLIVKDAPHIREALQAHYERFTSYYHSFLKSAVASDTNE